MRLHADPAVPCCAASQETGTRSTRRNLWAGISPSRTIRWTVRQLTRSAAATSPRVSQPRSLSLSSGVVC
jgi:hypothetical protein